jgi:penicillin-binding protein-related factor A (putative recombinase)
MPLNTITLPKAKGPSKGRGKVAEAKVAASLKNVPECVAKRIPDAKAGSFVAVAGDFSVKYRGKAYLLEVKQTDHDFRLPHGNVSLRQIALMRKSMMAGVICWALVYHAKLDAWRLVDVEFLRTRVGGSWDLSGFELRCLSEQIGEILRC